MFESIMSALSALLDAFSGVIGAIPQLGWILFACVILLLLVAGIVREF